MLESSDAGAKYQVPELPRNIPDTRNTSLHNVDREQKNAETETKRLKRVVLAEN